ncbi:MAG: class I SAM-dependent methyltransferase [Armatimonadetes bacterium]|nr:class I SAM-dependent methyltransferase [Armatimonadota bacterium]
MDPVADQAVQCDPGSFKDPSGAVFHWQGAVYRYVAPEDMQRLTPVLEHPRLRGLMAARAVVPTSVVELPPGSAPAQAYGTLSFLHHERIERLSYCPEWSAPMLADAGLHTLRLQEALLQEGLSLKDATPYNIQFRGTQPIFIDLPSIEPMREDGLWVPLNQFCETFVYPLLLHRRARLDLRVLLTGSPDGVDLETTYRLLGTGARLDPRLLSLVQLPRLLGRLMKPREVVGGDGQRAATLVRSAEQSRQVQLRTVGGLREHLRRLRTSRERTNWSEYTQTHSYDDQSEAQKASCIRAFLAERAVRSVLDLGCNTGAYSVLAAKAGCAVTAVDFDHACVVRLYEQAKAAGLNILPLCVDLTHPTPGLGWNNLERPRFLDRARADCVLALALLHHLLVTHRVPLASILDLLATLCERYLMIEYVDPADRMFRALLLNRSESYAAITLEAFRAAAQERFEVLSETQLGSMARYLFVLAKRP